MEQRVLDRCHGGEGKLTACFVLGGGDSEKGISFIHDDVIEPGASIGVHPHEASEEVYMVLEGAGTMVLDGAEHPIGAGDVCVCHPGHSHGIKNGVRSPMRLLVVGMK